ncbi:hypothetical protein CK203_093193 [Vitis vinifera]|uniref:Retrotransposon gag domain-containing protein n=1 Tax=Vitis vinifera TaxID=29760 RepID=A0A438CMI9_VITVI|nr:hypothetical protein CK203_093193 [Vitis vinifera]
MYLTAQVLPLGTSHGVPFHLSDHWMAYWRLACPPSLHADIERYSGIGCPKIHLRLYSTVMRAHGIDDAQLVAFFPMSLSGAAQRWFASTRVGGHRQRPMSLFLPLSIVGGQRWLDLKSLVHATFSVKEAIALGLWIDTTPSLTVREEPFGSSSRPGEVGSISYQHQRPAHHSPYRPPTIRAHFSHPQYQYQPVYVQKPYIALTNIQPRPPHPRATTHPPPRP